MTDRFGNTNVNEEDDDDDSEDVDYVPSEHGSSVSDDDDVGDSSGKDESDGDESEEGGRKRKADSPDSAPKKMTAAEKAASDAQRSNQIWEQFKTAVKQHREVQNSPEKQQQRPSEETAAKTEETKQPSPSENVIKKTIPEIISQTGTKASLTTPSSSSSSIGAQIKTTAAPCAVGKQQQPQPKPGISPSSSRLGSILAQIGQQKKSRNMLEQTREHWEEFKDKEGISDELALHNRGTKGYLDRQDFLARVDSRQEEKLREMRLQLMNKRRTT